MPEPQKLVRIPTLKTPQDFRNHFSSLGINLPCEDQIVTGAASPLAQRIAGVTINGKRIGNRWAIQPMEGWDGTTTGGATDEVRRRWQRFGASGAKLIYGGEAMAVRPDGRANPNQLIIVEQNKKDLVEVREILLRAFTRSGKYGGPFENRTRILRDIIAGIRASGNPIEIGVRLSAFDFVPFKPDPALSQPGKLGPGIPEDFSHCLPYRFGFGVS